LLFEAAWKAEPKRLRHRLLRVATLVTRCARRTRLHIPHDLALCGRPGRRPAASPDYSRGYLASRNNPSSSTIEIPGDQGIDPTPAVATPHTR
jgi:hypothetical protein